MSAPDDDHRLAPGPSPRAAHVVGRFAALAAFVLGSLSALLSFYWAVGGDMLIDTVGGFGRWGSERSARVAGALFAVSALKLGFAALGATAAGVVSGPAWSRGRTARFVAWLGAAGLTVYGGVLTIVGIAVERGIVDVGDVDNPRALAWHAWLWDPWFSLWGITLLVALAVSRGRR
jgi:hypothetical protein